MNRWLALLSLILLAGCVTTPPPFTGTSSQQALVRWSRPNHSLVSEAVFARAADSSIRVQLYKGSPKVLVTFSLDAEKNLTASGPMAGFGWRGPAVNAPLPLSTWARFLLDYQGIPSWPNGENEIHSGEARSAVKILNHQAVTLSVSNSLTGENITARFQAPQP